MLCRFFNKILSVTSLLLVMTLFGGGCNQNGGGLSGAGLLGNFSSPYSIAYTFGNNLYVSSNASGVKGYVGGPACNSALPSVNPLGGTSFATATPVSAINIVPGDNCNLYVTSLQISTTSGAGAIGAGSGGFLPASYAGVYSVNSPASLSTSLVPGNATVYTNSSGGAFNGSVIVNGFISTGIWGGFGSFNPIQLTLVIGDNLQDVSAALNLSYGTVGVIGLASTTNSIPPPTFCVASVASGGTVGNGTCDTSGFAPVAFVQQASNNNVVTEGLNVYFFAGTAASGGTYAQAGGATGGGSCTTQNGCNAEQFKIIYTTSTTVPVGSTCGTISGSSVTTIGCNYAQINALFANTGTATGVGTPIINGTGGVGAGTYVVTAYGSSTNFGTGISLNYNFLTGSGTYSFGSPSATGTLANDFLGGINGSTSPYAIPDSCTATTTSDVRYFILKHTDAASGVPSYEVIGFPFCHL